MRRAPSAVVALAIVVFLAGACGALGGEGPSGDAGSRSADRPASAPEAKEEPPPGATAEFATDFNRHSVPYSEILSGGPPKDGIPAIDEPRFVGVEEADAWLEPREPVILLQVADAVRAYPIQIIMWHEIVNDTVGGVPVTVTFCPLCNTAIAFERTVDGRELTFGTTGRLRFSNLIMYDRQTESWWQQATGDAIAGELTGSRLKSLPAPIVSWEDLRSAHPDAGVLSRETGYDRNYGQNPYAGYDDVDSSPFLYEGPKTPGDLPPMARVITVDAEEEAVAYPYEVLRDSPAINDVVNGEPIAVLWQKGTASALDEDSVDAGRDVGSAGVFSRKLDGRTLTFRSEGSTILDEETGSEWNVLGEAVGGELEGKRLEPVVSIDHFWFSWAAFRPETRVYEPQSER
ncbi:MAG: DUF3179 domain-containing protein [Rubrobacteraceae bacterium]|nr:DUF3179 domain-containing protein [Rubrobacteraceae bacterium]